MDSNALLDALKARFNVTENALARKVLHVEPNSIRDMRQRGLSEERALQIATLLEIPPEEVLPAIREERATDPAVKAVWKKIAESMRSALALLILGLGIYCGCPEKAYAIEENSTIGRAIHYAQRLRRKVRSWGFLGGLAGLALLTACGSAETADNHGLRFDFQVQSATTGIRWRADAAPAFTADMVDTEYTSLATCAQIAPLPTGPFVIYAADIHERFPDAWGVYFDDTHTAGIDTASNDLTYVTRHELLHHLLRVTTGNSDPGHTSPLWAQCAPIVNSN